MLTVEVGTIIDDNDEGLSTPLLRHPKGGTTGHTLAVKIAVSVPDTLHERAEDLAARLGLKRSQLYARAVARSPLGA